MMKYSKFLFSKGLLSVSLPTTPVSNKFHQTAKVGIIILVALHTWE